MAAKIILTITVFTCLAAIILALPASSQDKTALQDKIEEIKEAMIEQDVQVGVDGQGRILLNANTFNLSATLASAPNTTTSFTFIPLATILFGGQNGLAGLNLG